MQFKKATIILLILFLTLVTVLMLALVVLSLNKTLVDGRNNGFSQEKLSAEQQKIKALEDKTMLEIKQFIERGGATAGDLAPDVEKRANGAVGSVIMKDIKMKNQEQLQAEIKKIEQQTNEQIKNQSQND